MQEWPANPLIVPLCWNEQGQSHASLTEEMATVTFSVMVKIFSHF